MISTRVLLAIALCLVALSSSEAKLRTRRLAKATSPEVKAAKKEERNKGKSSCLLKEVEMSHSVLDSKACTNT